MVVCGIEEKECEGICEAVARNKSLVSFDLRKNATNARCVEIVKKNRYLIDVNLFVQAKSERKIEARNTILWEERIKWCLVLNLRCRVMVLGGECEVLPLEILYHIMERIPPTGILREVEIKRAERYSMDITTLGREKKDFLEFVFGKRITFVQTCIINF